MLQVRHFFPVFELAAEAANHIIDAGNYIMAVFFDKLNEVVDFGLVFGVDNEPGSIFKVVVELICELRQGQMCLIHFPKHFFFIVVLVIFAQKFSNFLVGARI